MSTAPPPTDPKTHREQEKQYDLLPLASILAIAFALRLAAVVFFTGTIDTEGAEYARIAENLLAGVGYVGIATPGTQLFFPPLFPYLIAAVSLVTQDAEMAGRIVSLIMGTLLVVPVYLIARHLYSRAAGAIAAFLVAVHPLLIGFSATVFSESTFLTLLTAAAYCTLRAYRQETARCHLLAGIVFGLAYLIRPEVAIYMIVASGIGLVYALLRRPSAFVHIVPRALCLPVAFMVVAAPYVLWLHGQTGQWRLEGKSPLNYATGRQMLAGTSLHEASYRVDAALTERGVWIQPNLEVIRSERFTAEEFRKYLVAQLKPVLVYLRNAIATSIYGSPPLFALAVLGLFRRPWHRELAFNQAFILGVLGVAGASLMFIYYYSDRFLLPVLPFFIVWASEGILAVRQWMRRTFNLVFTRYPPKPVEALFIAAVISLGPLTSLTAVTQVWELKTFSAASKPIKVAGEWLNAQAPGRETVVDTSAVLPFHASANYVPFPYSDSDTALRYFDKRRVNFIVLRDYDSSTRPYLPEWHRNGVPSPRAQLVYDVATPTAGRIRIYKWSPAADSNS